MLLKPLLILIMKTCQTIIPITDGTYNTQSAKYLGITITGNLDCGQHISKISSMGDFSKIKAMMMGRNSALRLKFDEIFFDICSQSFKTFSRDDVI